MPTSETSSTAMATAATAAAGLRTSVIAERFGLAASSRFAVAHSPSVTARDFLLRYPRGAYTGARTVNRTAILELDAHVKRLVASLTMMKFDVAHTTATATATATASSASTLVADDAVVQHPNHSHAAVGLKEPTVHYQAGNGEQSIDSGIASMGSPVGTEPFSVSTQLEELRSIDSLRPIAINLLQQALSKYYNIDRSSSSSSSSTQSSVALTDGGNLDEAKVLMLAGYCFEQNQPVVAVHLSPLTTPKNGTTRVAIGGRPRACPHAKDSQWAHDRVKYEQWLDATTNEVLLVDDSDNIGRLYEGLSSNFAIVMKRCDLPELVQQSVGGSGSGNGEDEVLVTAPLQDVLAGTIMKIVLDVCNKQGIPVVFMHPTLADLVNGKWRGAFVSSTSRLVLPINSVDLSYYKQEESAIVDIPPSNPLIKRISEAVSAEVSQRATPIF